MDLPAVLPKLTTDEVSQKGFLNLGDLSKLGKDALIFLTPTLLLYAAQLSGALSDHLTLKPSDLMPSLYVIGAFEGYVISTFIDYLKKLNSSV